MFVTQQLYKRTSRSPTNDSIISRQWYTKWLTIVAKMKGISSLLIATLVVSAYGESLQKLDWDTIQKLQQEVLKEELLSFLRETSKDSQTTNDKYKQFLIHSKNREIEDDDKNIETWESRIPPNVISLIKKYKQSVPNEDEAYNVNQNKNQKKDDSNVKQDNQDSNKNDIDGENSDQSEEESPVKSRQRKSISRKDKDSSDEDDDSNSSDDNASDKESRRSNSEKTKSKQMNSEESNSDEKSDDSDEKNSTGSQKVKPKKKNSHESSSDDKSNDTDEKNSGSRNDKSKQKNSDESNSDDKSDDNDSSKSQKDTDDDSKNSADAQKWKWILNRGDRPAQTGNPAPWNWRPEFNWGLAVMREELKSRLFSIVQLQRVVESLNNRTEELNKTGQWERTLGLTRAIAVHQKLLGDNILAVSRICNITEVQPHQIPELIFNCTINYSPRWRKLSNVGGPILQNNNTISYNNISLQELLTAHPNPNQTHIQFPNSKEQKNKVIVKVGEEEVNGTISWQSKGDNSAPPSDNTGEIGQETSLNITNSSDKTENRSNANDDEVSDKDQPPKPVPTNRKEDNATKHLNDQPGSNSQVPIKNQPSNAGNNNNFVPISNETVAGSRNANTGKIDLEPEVSNSSGSAAKAVATPNNILAANGNKPAKDINGQKQLDPTLKNEIARGQNIEKFNWLAGKNLAGSNNLSTAEPTSDDTSSQTDSTTSQSEPSSNSDSTNTEDPSSTSASSTEETTDTVQNTNSESESVFNTTAPRSTSLTDE